ncbi:CBO0543 family protein [Bacillus suaedaesalsae]|uniref:Permease n=1 Tax=Bacillus suaedaesalsae TaxID=2810349 RepID=A0ABS2DHC9_9BACI|nr:CBO0543 family protein [Bacillus suaedaesalsae]MBM6617867.1 hypothetical protein [Bacillus suaedaesalsae]
MNTNVKIAIKLVNQHHQNVTQDINQWLNNELFTWNWWVLLAFALLPWMVWFKFKERKILIESILVGTIAIIPTTYLDAIGLDLKFWTYPVQFIPLGARALPFDMSMVPVAYMLLYQFFKTWRAFIIGLLIMATLFAFIGEPVSKAMNLIYYLKWKYYYSFFYYIILGLFIKWFVNKCRDINKNNI